VPGLDHFLHLEIHISHLPVLGRDSMVQDWVAWRRLGVEGLQKVADSAPNVLASPLVGMKGLTQEDAQAPSPEVVRVSYLGRRQVQQPCILAAAHYSHVVSTAFGAVHSCVSYHLCDHRVNASDRENASDANLNVCDHGDRGNGFDVDLDRRCRQSRFGIEILRGILLLLEDGEPLVCSCDVGL